MLIRSSASHNALDSEKRTFLHPPIGQKMKKRCPSATSILHTFLCAQRREMPPTDPLHLSI
ncbi:hypothetical protein OUZ56_015819 [Daphnia magna]|uniref:Uncharacterized protein n=1 Tax=Daphnia magna TaxID=35525 RepID=A0ABR0ANU5_9CRUS|nr:hypothetical protein OUZ56_015819 [Daphnia magna]